MPKKLRLIAVASLAAMTLVAASACSSPSPSTASSTKKSLEVWTRSDPEESKAYQKIFDAFTEKTGIKVDFQPVAELDQQLQTRAASKHLPDVIINDSANMGTYESQGYLTAVDRKSITGEKDLSSRAWSSVEGADGKYYGVPFSGQTLNFLIRTDWLKKVGLPIPKTWEELKQVAEAFATKDPDGDGKNDTYGMDVPGTSENGYLSWWMSSFALQAGAQYVKKSGNTYTSGVDSAAMLKAVDYVKSYFCTPGLVQPGALTTNTANAHPFFETGKAGIYLTGPYMLSRFDTNLGKDKYTVIPAPAGPANSDVLAEGESIYLMAGNGSTSAATKLAEFMISPSAQKTGMDGGSEPVVRIPVNTTVSASKVYNDPRWDIFQNAFEKSSVAFPQQISWTPVRADAAEGLNGIMANCSGSSAAGLKALNKTVTDELKSQGFSK